MTRQNKQSLIICLQSSFFSSYTDNFARVLIIRVKEFVGNRKLNIKIYPDRVFRRENPRRDIFVYCLFKLMRRKIQATDIRLK